MKKGVVHVKGIIFHSVFRFPFMKSFLVLFLVSAFINIGDYNFTNMISWSADYRLTWDDFQGPVDPHRKFGVESATQVMIELNSRSEGNRVYFDVSCYFERDRSWTASRHSQHLLAHEQLHFDIAELYAREMRKRLSELSGLNHRNLESRVRHIYREVNREHNAFHDRYDRETNHSKNREKQEEWEALVKKMLEETRQYQAVRVSLAVSD